jgi:hypothetical protein
MKRVCVCDYLLIFFFFWNKVGKRFNDENFIYDNKNEGKD